MLCVIWKFLWNRIQYTYIYYTQTLEKVPKPNIDRHRVEWNSFYNI